MYTLFRAWLNLKGACSTLHIPSAWGNNRLADWIIHWGKEKKENRVYRYGKSFVVELLVDLSSQHRTDML